jgi:hypothetical protein
MAEEKWTIERLKGDNYMTWKFKLKHVLIGKELYEYVDGSIEVPAESANQGVKDAHKKKSNQAMSTIVLAVSDELLYLITECTTAKSAWEKLQSHFERDTLANKLFLKKRYFRTVMKETTTIDTHLKYMKEITDKLAAIKAPISEEDQVVTLLGSLPDSYSTVVTALEAQTGDLSLDFVHQALINEEQKRKEQDTMTANQQRKPNDAALLAERKSSGGVRLCYHCDQPGHIKRHCPRLRKRAAEHNAQPATEVDVQVSDEEAFVINEHGEFSSAPKHRWLIDSGASRHMTPNRSKFKTYSKFDKPQKVGLGDGHTIDALGVGNIPITVRISRRETKICTVYNVLHVPDLKVNLFSVKSAAEKNIIVQFGHSRCWLKNKHGKVRAMGTLINKLYYLDIDSDVGHTASVARTNIWHQRLAHANPQAIQ